MSSPSTSSVCRSPRRTKGSVQGDAVSIAEPGILNCPARNIRCLFFACMKPSRMSGLRVTSTSITALSHFCGACQRSDGRTLATEMSKRVAFDDGGRGRARVAGGDDGDVDALPLAEHEDAALELEVAEAAVIIVTGGVASCASRVLFFRLRPAGGGVASPGMCVGFAPGGAPCSAAAGDSGAGAGGVAAGAGPGGASGAASGAASGVEPAVIGAGAGGTTARRPARPDTPTTASRPTTARW